MQMNRGQKAIRRDRRSWAILAVVFALAALMGLFRLIEGTGDVISMLIPVLLTGLSVYMNRYQGGKGKK